VRQRLALARALIASPSIVLTDEPLSNLDPELNVHLIQEILRLHKVLGFTLVYVTHDRVEASALGSRLMGMQRR